MPLPEPHVGLVISYSYVWADESAAGATEGAKDRPCAVILCRDVIGLKVCVTVVPITHAVPRDLAYAVEIPPAVKAHLRLDVERSWLVASETNSFIWPGPDLRPVSRDRPYDFSYGVLPPRLLRRVRDRLLECAGARRFRGIERDE